MLDALVGGALVDRTPMAAKTLIANRALNAQQYEGVGQMEVPRQQHVNEMVVDGSKMQNAAICGVCSMQGHLNNQYPQLIENGGWESMPWVLKATISNIMTLTPTLTIRGGEIIQISSGESHNNLPNKAALGSNLRASTPSYTHQHMPHNNLPKTLQVHL
ncbi:hypothetical protein ACFXTH_029935 [Malus domestica]